MRNITGTFSSSVTAQFSTSDAPIVASAMFRARAGNTGAFYIGGDSGLSSAAGWELGAGESVTVSYDTGKVKQTRFWGLGSDSTQQCDYFWVTED